MPITAAPLEAFAVLGTIDVWAVNSVRLIGSTGFVLVGIPIYYITQRDEIPRIRTLRPLRSLDSLTEASEAFVSDCIGRVRSKLGMTSGMGWEAVATEDEVVEMAERR